MQAHSVHLVPAPCQRTPARPAFTKLARTSHQTFAKLSSLYWIWTTDLMLVVQWSTCWLPLVLMIWWSGATFRWSSSEERNCNSQSWRNSAQKELQFSELKKQCTEGWRADGDWINQQKAMVAGTENVPFQNSEAPHMLSSASFSVSRYSVIL